MSTAGASEQGVGWLEDKGKWHVSCGGGGCLVAKSCLTFCNSMDCIAHEILQFRIMEWVAIPLSRGSSQTRDRTQVSHIAGRFLHQLSHKGSPVKVSKYMITELVHWTGHCFLFIGFLHFPLIWFRWFAKVHGFDGCECTLYAA